jgi:putative acetyltransferase
VPKLTGQNIPPIRIRAFRPDDANALVDVFRDSVRVVARRDYTLAQVTAWAPDEMDANAWALRCASKQTFVAEIDAVPVGFTDLEPNGHLDMLFVHSQHQGKGIASALLSRVESVARQGNLTRLFTESSITARVFFERRGFRMLLAQVVSIRGQQFTNYQMEKAL